MQALKVTFKELSPGKKAGLILLSLAVLMVAPEFLIFVDAGGIEFLASYILLHLVAIKAKVSEMMFSTKNYLKLTSAHLNKTTYPNSYWLLFYSTYSLVSLYIIQSILIALLFLFIPIILGFLLNTSQ